MLMLALITIWLTSMPIVFSSFTKHDGYGSAGLTAFNAGVAIGICTIVFCFLLVPMLAIGDATMGEWKQKETIVSDSISISKHGKSGVSIECDDGQKVIATCADMQISQGAQDVGIEQELAQGKSVVVVQVATSDITTFQKEKVCIYVPELTQELAEVVVNMEGEDDGA